MVLDSGHADENVSVQAEDARNIENFPISDSLPDVHTSSFFEDPPHIRASNIPCTPEAPSSSGNVEDPKLSDGVDTRSDENENDGAGLFIHPSSLPSLTDIHLLWFLWLLVGRRTLSMNPSYLPI